MEWYRRVHFVSAVPMPEDIAEEYGTTINGMWASPETPSKQTIERAHSKGHRALFSVPLIALTPQVYERAEHQYLLAETCNDIAGDKALVSWYYWESKPVYSMCIYSPVFRGYLLDRCKAGIDRGLDVVNFDEINSSIGLMNRKAGGSGFCKHCLGRFRRHLQETAPGQSATAMEQAAALERADDETLRQRLRDDDELFEQYRRFHEREAFQVILGFKAEVAAYAQARNPSFAISSNVAYLGNLVPTMGDLWGPMWGEHLDFVMMENSYRPDPTGPHLLLPRGKFTAWYRLGSAFSSRAPAWICPSIIVPKQLAGQERIQYYLLMFLEAYANGGRWGYYWWPGVDVETRLKATAPEQLKGHIRFIRRYRDYFEGATSQNKLAILYLNSGIRRRPEAHFKYIALAQALSEAGYQYDVVYGGDDIYTPGDLDMEMLGRYRALLVPEVGGITGVQAQQLARLADENGVDVIPYAGSQGVPLWAQGAAQNEEMLFTYWREYQERERRQIVGGVSQYESERVWASDRMVNVVRCVRSEEQVLHVLNYNYDPDRDLVSSVEHLSVNVPWDLSEAPALRWLTLDGEQQLASRLQEARLVFEIPRLDLYGLAILHTGTSNG